MMQPVKVRGEVVLNKEDLFQALMIYINNSEPERANWKIVNLLVEDSNNDTINGIQEIISIKVKLVE